MTHIRRQTYLCVMRYKLRPMCNALTKSIGTSSTTCKKPHKFSSYLVDKYKWSSFIIICSAIMKVLQTVMLVAAIATASGQNVSFLPLLALFGAAGDMTPCSTEFSSIHTDSTHEEFMCLLYDMDRLIWSRRAPVPVLSSQSFDMLVWSLHSPISILFCKIPTPTREANPARATHPPTPSLERARAARVRQLPLILQLLVRLIQ